VERSGGKKGKSGGLPQEGKTKPWRGGSAQRKLFKSNVPAAGAFYRPAGREEEGQLVNGEKPGELVGGTCWRGQMMGAKGDG